MSELGLLIVTPSVVRTMWVSRVSTVRGRKRLYLCRKRDSTKVSFTWRVRDNEAGSMVCRFHEILQN